MIRRMQQDLAFGGHMLGGQPVQVGAGHFCAACSPSASTPA